MGPDRYGHTPDVATDARNSFRAYLRRLLAFSKTFVVRREGISIGDSLI